MNSWVVINSLANKTSDRKCKIAQLFAFCLYLSATTLPGNKFVAMGWHGVTNTNLGQQDASFCHPWEFFCNFSLLFIFVEERSREILAELSLGLCDTLEN